MSVLWGFACLTHVTLIVDSSVASLLRGASAAHRGPHALCHHSEGEASQAKGLC